MLQSCYEGRKSELRKYSSRGILRILHEDGWVEKNQRGSHVQLVHPTKPGKVTVPHPRLEKTWIPGQ
ncbi:MAG: type II toxin-antitoxin system HicA family toxin [Bacillota bacterium]